MSQSISDYYTQTIGTLDGQVAEFHAEFRQYLQCKQGCAGCCKTNVEFRISYIEAVALQQALIALPAAQQARIRENLASGKPDCPLLVNERCSVYASRPALCRAYGTIIQMGETVATCELNFNGVDADIPLKKLDLLPYYNVLDDLSALVYKPESPENNNFPPKHSIRDFLTLFSGEKADVSMAKD